MEIVFLVLGDIRSMLLFEINIILLANTLWSSVHSSYHQGLPPGSIDATTMSNSYWPSTPRMLSSPGGYFLLYIPYSHPIAFTAFDIFYIKEIRNVSRK